jgi:hypothetical protein
VVELHFDATSAVCAGFAFTGDLKGAFVNHRRHRVERSAAESAGFRRRSGMFTVRSVKRHGPIRYCVTIACLFA